MAMSRRAAGGLDSLCLELSLGVTCNICCARSLFVEHEGGQFAASRFQICQEGRPVLLYRSIVAVLVGGHDAVEGVQATASRAIVIGFNVRRAGKSRALAGQECVDPFRSSDREPRPAEVGQEARDGPRCHADATRCKSHRLLGRCGRRVGCRRCRWRRRRRVHNWVLSFGFKVTITRRGGDLQKSSHPVASHFCGRR